VKRYAIVLGLAAAVASTWAGPAFITMPPAITPSVAPVSPGPLRNSGDLNQAAMSQIINSLNQRQLQLNVATAQTTVQRPIFVPQTIIVRPAK
jgi:hypothetical protein